MIVLGIDTATSAASVCLGSEEGPLASAMLDRPRGHGGFLDPAIAFCAERAGVGLREVDGVAVTLGPGLFTGLRVGLATAQAFAHARQLPTVGRSSLDLVAFGYRHVRPDRVIVAVLDARRGELFWARYRPTADGVQRTSDQIVGSPERLAAELAADGEDVLCVGEGAQRHTAALSSARAQVAAAWAPQPSAVTLVELAVPAFARQATQRPEDLRPVYLRAADARISWRNRGAVLGGTAAEEAR